LLGRAKDPPLSDPLRCRLISEPVLALRSSEPMSESATAAETPHGPDDDRPYVVRLTAAAAAAGGGVGGRRSASGSGDGVVVGSMLIIDCTLRITCVGTAGGVGTPAKGPAARIRAASALRSAKGRASTTDMGGDDLRRAGEADGCTGEDRTRSGGVREPLLYCMWGSAGAPGLL